MTAPSGEPSQRTKAWQRFAAYGAAGWVLEVLMTGTSSALFGRDRAGTARTYLWMHPIYGLGGLLLERVGRRVARWPRLARCLAYLPVIYGIEYATGATLRHALGRCPWDYGRCGISLRGLIRLDYAPLWLGVGWLFEPLRDRLDHKRERLLSVSTILTTQGRTTLLDRSTSTEDHTG